MKCIFKCCLFLNLLLSFRTSSATHLAGGDLSYQCLNNLTYEIQLTIYRDCAGSAMPNGAGIRFWSVHCNQFFTDTLLKIPGTGEEITYLCPSASTNCTDTASVTKGIEQYIYKGTITFPLSCDDWVMEWQYCCRNCDITTMLVSNPCLPGSNPAFNIPAHLDNLNFNCNSSPQFTNIPIIYACAGQAFNYNHGVIDPDGDSLVYSLVPALVDSVDSIPYLPGYSSVNPILSSPQVSIDPLTGDILMNPTSPEVGVISVLIEEYRNGQLVGSVVRDMEIYVLNCSNTIPTASGINGTNIRDTLVCPGDSICFDIFSNDPDSGQIISMSWNSGIGNASFFVSGSPNPVGHFCWVPDAGDLSSIPHTFTLSVVDNACPNSGYQVYSFNIYVSAPLFSVSILDVSCPGSNDGMAVVSALSGDSTYSYEWNTVPVSFNDTISSLSPGTYLLLVTDSLTGCAVTDTININQSNIFPLVSFSYTNALCFGSSTGVAIASGSGGAGGYSFVWNTIPSQFTDTVDSLPAGIYTVVLTDSRGCSDTDSVVIGQPPFPLSLTIDSVSQLFCYGDTNGIAAITAYGGTPGYIYEWNSNPSQTGDTAINLPAGYHTYMVTDSNGCMLTDSVLVIQPFALTIIDSVQEAICNLSNGYAWVTVSGGTPGYTYLWDILPTQTNDTAFNLPAGLYDVIVTDSNQCSDTLTVALPNITPLNSAVTIISQVSCFGFSDASAFVEVLGGGTGFYNYVWDPGSLSTDDSISGLPAGIYFVTVNDLFTGCVNIVPVAITQPDEINANIFTINANCYGDSSGYAALGLFGGIPPYNILWNPGGYSDDTIPNIPAGTYNVTISDSNQCLRSFFVDVYQPDSISINANLTDLTCNGASNGSIDITVSGGIPSYSYLWTPGNLTSEDITALDSSLYTLEVTDTNGCTKTVSFLVSQPPPESVNAGADITICDTSIYILNGSNAPAGYTGSWTSSNGSIIFSNANDPQTTVSGLAAGFNNITWTITNDTCTFSDEVSIYIYAGITSNAGQDQYICSNSAALSSIVPSGFNGSWSSPDGNISFSNTTDPNAIVSNLASGSNLLIWTVYNNYCSYLDTVNVFVLDTAVVSAGGDQDLCGLDSSVLNASQAPQGFTGLWTSSDAAVVFSDPNDFDATAGNLSPGTTLFIWSVGIGSCMGSDTMIITMVNQAAANAGNDTVVCDSSVVLSAAPVPGGLTGTWTSTDPLITFSDINDPYSTAYNLAEGPNILFWSVGSGTCFFTDTVLFESLIPANVNAGTDQYLCQVTGTLLNAVPAPAGFTGTWNSLDPGVTFSNASDPNSTAGNLPVGNFALIWTVSGGACSGSDTIWILIIDQSSVTAGNDTTLCSLQDAVALHGSVVNGFTGTWTSSDPGIIFSPGTQSPDPQVSNFSAGVITFIWTLSSSSCSLSSTPVTITAVDLVQADAGTDSSVCGFSLQLNAVLPAGYNGSWTTNCPDAIFDNMGNPVANVTSLCTEPFINTFTWTITSSGCTSQEVINVLSFVPVVIIPGPVDTVCEPEITLSTAAPMYPGYWSQVNSTGIIADTSQIVTPAALQSGLNHFLWMGANGPCQVSSLHLYFFDNSCDLELPTGFTPNGDGFNDDYIIHGIQYYPNNMFFVYNRWGNLVFEKEDFFNGSWHGQNKSGEELPDGTYYVILDISVSDIRLNTYVDLRR